MGKFIRINDLSQLFSCQNKKVILKVRADWCAACNIKNDEIFTLKDYEFCNNEVVAKDYEFCDIDVENVDELEVDVLPMYYIMQNNGDGYDILFKNNDVRKILEFNNHEAHHK